MSQKTFRVSIYGDCFLTVDEIWPDGGAPDNPTATDVVAVMRARGGGVAALITDWDLPLNMDVDGIDYRTGY